MNIYYQEGRGAGEKLLVCIAICLLFIYGVFTYKNHCEKKMADLWTLPQPEEIENLESMPTSVTVTSILRGE